MRCVVIDTDAPGFEAESMMRAIAPGVGLPGRVWVSRSPVEVDNLARDPSFTRAATAEEAGLLCGAGVPIIRDRRVVAVLEALHDVPVEIEPLVAAAADLVDAEFVCDNTEASEALAARHAALAELGRLAVVTHDIDAIIVNALSVAVDALAVDSAALLERVDDEHLRVRRTVGYDVDPVGRPVPTQNTLSGHILAQDGPVVVRDVANDPRAANSWLLHEYGVASAAGVVVRGPDRPAGVLAVHSSAPRDFTIDDIHFLRTAANLVAASIARHRADEELRRVSGVLDAVVAGATDPIFVKDRIGRYLLVNEAAARVIGRPIIEILGRTAAEVFPPGAAAVIRADDEQVMAAGEWQTLEEAFELDGVPRVFLASKGPYVNSAGEVVGVIGIARDITERKRMERQQAVLAETSHLLTGTLDSERALREVAAVPVPEAAAGCVVDIVRDDRALDCVGQAGTVPDEARERVADVVASGRPVLEASFAIVPMIARSRTLGAITIAGPRLDELDFELVRELGRRVALAADNARTFAERDRIARTLQAGLLPPNLPEIPGVAIATRYHAAGEGMEAGGDFYDAFPAPGGWLIVIGDVCGRGAEAAALTSVVRHTLRGAAAFEGSPTRLLYALNTALLRARDDLRFCTMLCAHLSEGRDGLSLRLAGGGHPLPFVVRADGTVETFGIPGTLVGALDAPRFEEVNLLLEPGDMIVMFTDGLLDASRPRGHAGAEVVEAVLRRVAGQPPDAVAQALADVAAEAAGGAFDDDVAILVLNAERVDADIDTGARAPDDALA